MKRGMDIILSAFFLLLLAPISLFVIVEIIMSSRGSIFYPWKVVGKIGRDFIGYKFRSMYIDADERKKELSECNEVNGPMFKIKNDPRVTPFGQIIRKFGLDEIPQLYNVLKSDMSMVGPRPPLREELANFEEWQKRKLSAKPGAICLTTIRKREAIGNFDEWVKLELAYIDN